MLGELAGREGWGIPIRECDRFAHTVPPEPEEPAAPDYGDEPAAPDYGDEPAAPDYGEDPPMPRWVFLRLLLLERDLNQHSSL